MDNDGVNLHSGTASADLDVSGNDIAMTASGSITVNGENVASTVYVNSAVLAEETRATNAEGVLQTNIDNEVTRATNAEGVLQTNIDNEVTRATNAEGVLQTNIDNEVTRATNAEGVLQTNIDTNTTAISNEVTRATNAEGVLQTNITNEVTRATNAEGVLQTNINNEATTRFNADVVLTNNLNAEVTTRTALIRQEADGIHIGADSLVYDQDYFASGEDRLFTTGGQGIAVTEMFSVKPAQSVYNAVITPGAGELPKLDNGSGTSTVYTQTGTVTQVTSNSTGGGVTLETNGDVTLAKPTTAGEQVDYLQVHTFLVDNLTGNYIPGTDEWVGGYIDGNGNFVKLGDLDQNNVNGLLDLGAIDPDDLEDITTEIPGSDDGGDLTVGGDASIAGDTHIAGTLSLGDTGSEGNGISDVAGAINNNAHAISDERAERIYADNVLNNKIDDVKDDLDDLEDRVDAVGAFSAAFSALVPNDRAAGNTQVALGLGTYSGETAIAAGVFHYVNDNILINAGVSHSMKQSETAGRAGITYGF